MTASRDSDRLIRAWLDLMPSEAPARAIDAVLQIVESRPQVRPPLGATFRRPFQMTRFTSAALALAIVVVLAAGALVLTRSTAPPVGTSPLPSVQPSTEASGASLPAALEHTWIGADRIVAGSPSVSGLALIAAADSIRISSTNQMDAQILGATAGIDAAGRLRLQAPATQAGARLAPSEPMTSPSRRPAESSRSPPSGTPAPAE